MYFSRNFPFTELVNYLLYHYFINYHCWKFISGKYDNLSWDFNNDPDIEWHYSFDNPSDENIDFSENDKFAINYDSDNFSCCSTPYSIIDYDNFWNDFSNNYSLYYYFCNYLLYNLLLF